MKIPKFATQLDENKQPEKVDISKFSYKIICKEPGCFQIRYVQGQDRTQTRYCKSCARIYRLRARAERARNKRARKNKEQAMSAQTLLNELPKL